MTTPETAWVEAMKYENRPNPYPFFDELRKTPVVQVADKTYVVTGYRELLALAHDPHISSDVTRSPISSRPATESERPAPRASTLTAGSRASSCLTRRTTTGHAGR
jgi:fatty acid omega-hydroxylase